MAVYETDEIIEKVILVGVAFDTDDDTERSLDELGELAKTAGAQTVGRMIQTRDNFHPATYIGKGKIEELRLMIDELDATGIICDDELSPAQFKNLEDELGVKVMDRTMVILDIFAARATSSEGKIQVEMAQLMLFFYFLNPQIYPPIFFIKKPTKSRILLFIPNLWINTANIVDSFPQSVEKSYYLW